MTQKGKTKMWSNWTLLVICWAGLMVPTIAHARPNTPINHNPSTVTIVQTTSSSSSSQSSSSSYSSSSSQSISSGTHTINGRTLHYELRGNESANAEVRADNGNLKMIAQVDQTRHVITVYPDQITYNDTSTPISGFREVDITIEYGDVAIAVDGQQIFP